MTKSLPMPNNKNSSEYSSLELCRKEKRKALKKEKRKQKRKEIAEQLRLEELTKLNDPNEQRRIEIEEEIEKERVEKERRDFEERERLFSEELAKRKAIEEEEEQRRLAQVEEQKLKQNEQVEHENDEEDDWEYVEEGPPEIIWKGNEIIVKKNKVRVKKKDEQSTQEDPNRPTSNPLPPQSDAFSEYKSGSMVSAQQLLDDVAQQVPNFGTEHDKAHCPFHLKTGACRFGSRCNRVHFYPDKSCTLLIRNMYSGPGLAWEQDEGLEVLLKYERKLLVALLVSSFLNIKESTPACKSFLMVESRQNTIASKHTDEEVERCYEEFYEDVHTEFLKFGEIINFKVCRNSSSHLRGNVYVHYKSLESSVFANQSINGRYFAGKQVTCEFVNVTKWKVAICGEFMKSKLEACSRGSACNFIHCFRNPGGDYEWADWDKPPPRYWIRKMAALFGYTDQSSFERQAEDENMTPSTYTSSRCSTDLNRYHSRRSQSKEAESPNIRSRSRYEEQNAHDIHQSSHSRKHSSKDRNWRDFHYETYEGEETESMDHPPSNGNYRASESDKYCSDRDGDRNWHGEHTGRRLRSPVGKSQSWYHNEDHTKSRHRGSSRKRSREEADDHKERKNSVKHTKERSKDVHYSGKRSSRHHYERSVSIDDRWDGGSRIHESEHAGG
ncbi:hypothetical protein Leryth_007250 [Lithospermum erythrorhizon]|nr:hypothetical protein Leryth_007250 [Lithospermum erythrorhizon]